MTAEVWSYMYDTQCEGLYREYSLFELLTVHNVENIFKAMCEPDNIPHNTRQ